MAKLIYEKRGHVAYLTLNRPEAMNAMDAREQVRPSRRASVRQR